MVVSVALEKLKVISPPGVVSPSSQVPSASPSIPSFDVSYVPDEQSSQVSPSSSEHANSLLSSESTDSSEPSLSASASQSSGVPSPS